VSDPATTRLSDEEFERLVKYSEDTWVAPITAEARRARGREEVMEKLLAEALHSEKYFDAANRGIEALRSRVSVLEAALQKIGQRHNRQGAEARAALEASKP
jgi:hypothetical protein